MSNKQELENIIRFKNNCFIFFSAYYFSSLREKVPPEYHEYLSKFNDEKLLTDDIDKDYKSLFNIKDNITTIKYDCHRYEVLLNLEDIYINNGANAGSDSMKYYVEEIKEKIIKYKDRLKFLNHVCIIDLKSLREWDFIDIIVEGLYEEIKKTNYTKRQMIECTHLYICFILRLENKEIITKFNMIPKSYLSYRNSHLLKKCENKKKDIYYGLKNINLFYQTYTFLLCIKVINKQKINKYLIKHIVCFPSHEEFHNMKIVNYLKNNFNNNIKCDKYNDDLDFICNNCLLLKFVHMNYTYTICYNAHCNNHRGKKYPLKKKLYTTINIIYTDCGNMEKNKMN